MKLFEKCIKVRLSFIAFVFSLVVLPLNAGRVQVGLLAEKVDIASKDREAGLRDIANLLSDSSFTQNISSADYPKVRPMLESLFNEAIDYVVDTSNSAAERSRVCDILLKAIGGILPTFSEARFGLGAATWLDELRKKASAVKETIVPVGSHTDAAFDAMKKDLETKLAAAQDELNKTATALNIKTAERQKLEQDLANLKAQHKAIVDLLQSQIAGLNAKIDDLTQQVAVRDITIKDHEKTIADRAATIALRDTTIKNLQAEIAKLKTEIAATKHDLDDALAREKKEREAKEQAEAEVAKLTIDLAQEKLMRSDDSSAAATEITKLADKIATLTADLAAANAEKDAQAQTISDLRDDLAEAEDQKKKDDAALADEKKKHDEEVAALQLTLDLAKKSGSDALAKANTQHQDDLAALKSAYQEALKKLRTEHAAALQKIKDELAVEQKAHKDEVDALQKQHKKELDDERAKHEADVAALTTAHEKALSDAEAKRLKDLTTAEDKHKEALAQQKKEYDEKLSRLRAAHKEKIDELNEKHQAALDSAAKQHKQELADAETSRQHDLDEARKEHERVLAEEREKHEKALKDKQREHHDALDAEKAAREKERKDLASKIAELEVSLKTKSDEADEVAALRKRIQELMDELATLQGKVGGMTELQDSINKGLWGPIQRALGEYTKLSDFSKIDAYHEAASEVANLQTFSTKTFPLLYSGLVDRLNEQIRKLEEQRSVLLSFDRSQTRERFESLSDALTPTRLKQARRPNLTAVSALLTFASQVIPEQFRKYTPNVGEIRRKVELLKKKILEPQLQKIKDEWDGILDLLPQEPAHR